MRQVVVGLLLIVFLISVVKRKQSPAPEVSEQEVIETSFSQDPTPANKILPPEVPAKTAPEAAKPGQSFKEWSQAVLQSLPKTSDLKKLSPAEVHYTPELLREAGRSIGRIAQAISENPTLSEDGLAFYKSCFLRGDAPVQIRALCLANHRELRALQGGSLQWTHEEQQAHVQVLRLASMIPVARTH